MQRWRDAWQRGIGCHLSTAGLYALREALVSDDPRLVQGHTTVPKAPGVRRSPDGQIGRAKGPRPTGCCAIGLAGWLGDGLNSVGEVYRHFEATCDETDEDECESGFAYHFVDWFDHTPRDVMRRELLVEVERSLRMRLSGNADRFRREPRAVDAPGTMLAIWLDVAERTHGSNGGDSRRGSKGKKPGKAKRELVGC